VDVDVDLDLDLDLVIDADVVAVVFLDAAARPSDRRFVQVHDSDYVSV